MLLHSHSNLMVKSSDIVSVRHKVLNILVKTKLPLLVLIDQ